MSNSKICFILYKPAVPGNIGAAARAMKTMGFTELRLINPADHLSEEAKMFAHGSRDVLENANIYNSYDEAVSDIDFVICTTAKEKSAKVDYIPADEIFDFTTDKLKVCSNIAIVFGTEESGLPKKIIQKSNVGVTIPMATEFPSLNLSQAVMIISYVLAGAGSFDKKPLANPQEESTWRELQDRTSTILQNIGINPPSPLYHRIIERLSFLKASDARLVHSITSKLMKSIKNRS